MNTRTRNTKEVNSSILAGLEEAELHSRGKLKLQEYSIEVAPLPQYRAKAIKKLRNRLQLTQEIMAKTMGVSVKTVEAWESGRNIPQGPAQRILSILEKNPELLQDLDIVVQK